MFFQMTEDICTFMKNKVVIGLFELDIKSQFCNVHIFISNAEFLFSSRTLHSTIYMLYLYSSFLESMSSKICFLGYNVISLFIIIFGLVTQQHSIV